MPDREFVTRSEDDTIRVGRHLAEEVSPPLIITLSGELGSGKTTLAKGIISGLGLATEDEVTSPTFTVVHVFRNHIRVFHVDLYRIGDVQGFETLGIEDLFEEPAIVIVEWPQKLVVRTDWPVLDVRLEHVDLNSRRISVAFRQ